MRNLQANTKPWDEWMSLDHPALLAGFRCDHCDSLVDSGEPVWRYLLVQVSESVGEISWCLYALEQAQNKTYVLGVFDTRDQAEFYLALHSDNPLKVPALLTDELQWPMLELTTGGQLLRARYQGVYKVGLKSYRVQANEESDLLTLWYIDRYHTEYLGEAAEKEACLKIYSHFDARLRGCKMC
ncbi:hypothetical protein LH51_08225 [Nitrincola sp. A-D6]|uniref:hypothetical protein n=1 Tax=Nitrincola sp. A-D6 TaxID=1545442 RepID=UPI00051FAE6F|nr:hypothetical protein [Nitrincola sp. A-D6]KGK42328.1 hypothetical protein LH51_08225 [Nitrincola sp. A-D6]